MTLLDNDGNVDVIRLVACGLLVLVLVVVQWLSTLDVIGASEDVVEILGRVLLDGGHNVDNLDPVGRCRSQVEVNLGAVGCDGNVGDRSDGGELNHVSKVGIERNVFFVPHFIV